MSLINTIAETITETIESCNETTNSIIYLILAKLPNATCRQHQSEFPQTRKGNPGIHSN